MDGIRRKRNLEDANNVFLVTLTTTFVSMLLCLPTGLAKNVVIIVADDAGLESGVYGNTKIRTPHLDRLGSRSKIFDRAFTSVSSCSPSRSALLTGLPTHQNGMYGLHQGRHHFNCFDEVRSLSTILGENGIKTGIIGKKHVGPTSVFPFDFSETEENNSILQVGRNITLMKELARKFFQQYVVSNSSFMLYVGFHDPHRCDHIRPELGSFCEKFGADGSIPDWTPEYYDPSEVEVPFYVQDTVESRKDIAAQYTTLSRLDQGIGLILNELTHFGLDNDTLIIYTSDNGIPFPNGRTNFYDSGISEPLLISSPYMNPGNLGSRSRVLTSLLDITPTILDWFEVSYPSYKIGGHQVKLKGQSLLPLLHGSEDKIQNKPVFGSHNLHEITMYYPMRYIRTKRFKLIHNLNFWAPFPIDQDFYLSPSFQDILQRTIKNETLPWFKTLKKYYYRPEWEMFDLKYDRMEIVNVADKAFYLETKAKLQKKLSVWMNSTGDPWLCGPHSVLENKGRFSGSKAQCMHLHNELISTIP